MKMKIDSLELKRVLNHAERIASSPKVIPALNTLLLSVISETALEVTAFDMTVGSLGIYNITEGERGRICVPVKPFASFVKNLGDRMVDVSIKEQVLVLNAGDLKCKIECTPADNFPVIPVSRDEFENGKIDIEDYSLDSLLDVSYATAKDSVRACLSGVSIKTSNNAMKFCSTDGHRLGYKEKDVGVAVSLEKGVLVPKSWAEATSKLLKDSVDDKVSFFVNKKIVAVKVGEVILFSNLLFEDFPDYEEILNGKIDVSTRIRAKKTDAVSAVRMAAALTPEKTVRFEITDKEVMLYFDAGIAQGTGRFDCEYLEGDSSSRTVSLNSAYVLDALDRIKGDYFVLSQGDDMSPVFIEEDIKQEGSDSVHLIMPIRQ